MTHSSQDQESDSGAAAVEFALLLPLLILLLGGIIDFGFVFNAQISLTHAAREGARVEALEIDDGVAVATTAYSAPATTNTQAQVVQSCSDSDVDRAVVQITADYTWFFLFMFDDRGLVGEAAMRCGG